MTRAPSPTAARAARRQSLPSCGWPLRSAPTSTGWRPWAARTRAASSRHSPWRSGGAVADFDKTVTGLRRWTKDHDPHVRAAVELLIDLGPWLHRGSFLEACVRTDHGETWIDWGEAREYAARRGLPASTTEIGLLRLAGSLGRDET